MQRKTTSPSSSSSFTASSSGTRHCRRRYHVATRLHLLSASYGPAEGRQDAITGALVDYNKNETHVPYTRDVLPFLKALMSLLSLDGDYENTAADGKDDDSFEDKDEAMGKSLLNVRKKEREANEGEEEGPSRTTTNETNPRYSFPLMDGRPMNAVFGDPCPGVTKVLKLEYLFRDFFFSMEDGDEKADDESGESGCGIKECCNMVNSYDDGCGKRGKRRKHQRFHCIASRKFQSTFREHERVLLKRQDPLSRRPAASNDQNPVNAAEEHHNNHQKMITKEKQSENSSADHVNSASRTKDNPSCLLSPITRTVPQPSLSSLGNQWETTLPIILPFLTIRRRAICQMTCSSWKDIVLENGIAISIDINDVGLFPTSGSSQAVVPSSPPANSDTPPTQNQILRGLVNHSHSSLEALVLNDFISLNPVVDLHPALPYCRKLKCLDISRCQISDDTLHLISTCIAERLEVLYMKGLRRITNDGVVRLVQSCVNLRVLDVSQIYQLDDSAGMAIGRHLNKLEVFQAKDNHRLTNRSLNLITMNNSRLLQSTFWGCIKLKSMCFHDAKCTKRLILLNLWGCHNLTDDVAEQIIKLSRLRSLCVSECYRLTDSFVKTLSLLGPRLIHLQLRYLKRITDESLKCLAQMCLYSLDLSFCTKLSVGGVTRLLTERFATLAELRLYSCRQLDVEGGGGLLMMNRVGDGDERSVGSNGRQFVKALRFSGPQGKMKAGIISLLDLRECQQHEPFVRDKIFLDGMAELGFDEALRGLFIRPAGYNQELRRQLMSNFSDDVAKVRLVVD